MSDKDKELLDQFTDPECRRIAEGILFLGAERDKLLIQVATYRKLLIEAPAAAQTEMAWADWWSDVVEAIRGE